MTKTRESCPSQSLKTFPCILFLMPTLEFRTLLLLQNFTASLHLIFQNSASNQTARNTRPFSLNTFSIYQLSTKKSWKFEVKHQKSFPDELQVPFLPPFLPFTMKNTFRLNLSPRRFMSSYITWFFFFQFLPLRWPSSQVSLSSDSISYPSRLLKVFSSPQPEATLLPQTA